MSLESVEEVAFKTTAPPPPAGFVLCPTASSSFLWVQTLK